MANNALNRLINLKALTEMITLAYHTGHREARGETAPLPPDPETAALLEVARRRAMALEGNDQAEEPPAPAWLRKMQRPLDEEEEQPGVGC